MDRKDRLSIRLENTDQDLLKAITLDKSNCSRVGQKSYTCLVSPDFLTSASVSPCVSMMLPRYVKSSTSSITLYSSVTGAVLGEDFVLSSVNIQGCLQQYLHSASAVGCGRGRPNHQQNPGQSSAQSISCLFCTVFIIQSITCSNKKGYNKKPCLMQV